MNDSPAFLRRRKPSTEETAAAAMTQLPAIHDPRVQQFVSDFIGTQKTMHDQAQLLRQLELENDKLTGRCDWQDKELERLLRSHDAAMQRVVRSKEGFSRGYHAQQAEIAVLVTAAEAAKENALAAVEASFKTSVTTIKAAFEGFSEAVNASMAAITKSVAEETSERAAPLPAAATLDDVLSDESNRQIAARYGANNRPPESE
jgi:predicted secreted protein